MEQDESVAKGRSARTSVPRSTHAGWEAPPGRPDPIAVLEAQDATRMPDLVPLRHTRMLASPFAFYRGAAAMMAGDLAPTPTSGIKVQCCGDAHLANFGGFESPERSMVFDINDFDETVPGPWEWDVKRLAASIVDRLPRPRFRRRGRPPGGRAGGSRYRDAMREFAAQRNLDVWYSRLDQQGILSRWGSRLSASTLKRFERNVVKAKARTTCWRCPSWRSQLTGRSRSGTTLRCSSGSRRF